MLFLLFNITLVEGKEVIIVSGYGVENNYLDVHDDCPASTICSNSWFKYTIKVKDTLRGKKLDGEVIAIKKQHATFVMDKSELAIFVLSEISDVDIQKKFNAKYYVHEFSRPKTVYCFNEKLENLNLEVEDEISYHPIGMWETQCMNKDELFLSGSAEQP